MKFWLKIYIPTFVLFTIAFYTGIFLMSHLSYANSISTAREQAFAQHKFIMTSFSKDLNAILERNQKDEQQKAFVSLLSYYTESYQDISLQLFQDGEPFNELTQNLPLTDTFRNPSDCRYSIILKDGSQSYIVVAGTLFNDYVLLYVQDITPIINAQKNLINELLIAGMGIEFVFTVLLYLLIKKLTKPVKVLQEVTNRITAGEYDVRADVKGRDEIAALAAHFNEMAAEVSSRIQEQKKIALQKQQFIDNLAHELKTPLTTIYSSAELLQTTKFSEDDLIDATSQIMRQVNRIQELQKRLLDMAMNRNYKIENKPIRLSSLFQKVRDEMSSQLSEKGLDFIVSCNTDILFGDAVLIENLLTNLLDNATKASDDHKTIYLFSFRQGDTVTIELHDEGKGISEEHLEYIFDPFYRTDFARIKSEDYGGAGLGLALCKQIAEMHSAKIEVQSVPGKGTTFILTFTTSQQLHENLATP